MRGTIYGSMFAGIVFCASATLALATAPVCGDVNATNSVNTTDALLVLKKGVGQDLTLNCSGFQNAIDNCNASLDTCSDALAACGNVGCSGTVRFTDNSDGTVTDCRTGLMWEKKTTDGSVHDWGKSYIVTVRPPHLDGVLRAQTVLVLS